MKKMNSQKIKPEQVRNMDDNIMNCKYRYDITTAAKVHVGFNPIYMQMRQEVHNMHKIHLEARREKIRELYIQDFLQQHKELREMNPDFINTQP